MKEITSITYSIDSGSILPELHWHEETLILADRVTFTRIAFQEASQVNSGTWEIPADAQQTAELFNELKKINWKDIQRVEPQDAPDGGGSRSFQINFSDGGSVWLDYSPGVEYVHGNEVVDPIMEFLKDLPLPADAVSQYNLDGG